MLRRSAGLYRLPCRKLISKYYYTYKHCQHFRQSSETLDPVCPGCGTTADLQPRKYYMPEFGFVAEYKTAKLGMSPPKT